MRVWTRGGLVRCAAAEGRSNVSYERHVLMRRVTHGFRPALLATALVALLAACGDDTATQGDGTAAEGDIAAYCEHVATLDAQEGMPSDEQFDELRRLAPDDISAEIAVVADAFEERGEDASHEPEVERAFETIQAYESEHCVGSDEGDAGA